MRLFAYEFKKNIFRLSVLFLALGLFVVNGYKIFESVKIYGDRGRSLILKGEDFGREMYEAFKGEITPELIERVNDYKEKMSAIIASGNYSTTEASDEFYCGYAFGDNQLIQWTQEEIRYALLYGNKMLELSEKCDNNIDFYEGKNPYKVRELQLVKSIYKGRSVKVYGHYGAFKLFFDYEFSSLLIMIMLIYLFAASFAGERSIGADRIIRSCGRAGSVFWAKHFTMYAFIVFSELAFAAFDLAGFARYYGAEFITQPLYAIEEYCYTPFGLTIIGAMLLTALFRIAALLFVGELIQFISTLTKNVGAALTASFAAMMILIFANRYVPEVISPFTLFSGKKTLSEFSCVNIFGFPVLSVFVTLFITVLLTVILHIMCFLKAARSFKVGDIN